MKRLRFVSAICLSLMFLGFSGLSRTGDVTSERLVRALEEPQNWLTYRGDYSGRNYRTLKQIHKDNVADLRVDWVFQTGVGAGAKFQTVPLVVDGMMYITAPYNNGYALDARTGRQLWRYQRRLPDQSLCCGPINRGFALLRDKLFMATLDSHLVALDTKTGNVLWDVKRADYRIGYSSTGAPLIVKDKVIIGTGGGEYGVRCFLDAYDPDTGKRLWRFWTIPEAGESGSETWLGDSWKTGGAPTWMTGTYDPELDLLYWCTGNPAPDLNGETRLGDNLYSASVVALDPDTGGELVWAKRVGRGSALGGIHWGLASDGRMVYVPNSDHSFAVIRDPRSGKVVQENGSDPATPGVYGIELSGGETLWSVEPDAGVCEGRPGCLPLFSAAPTVIEGAVLVGSLDGHMRAFSTENGSVLWDVDTAQEFDTVNGVPGRGGSIDGPGPVVARGVILVNSGYDMFSEMPGNLLLAYRVPR